MSDKLNIKQKVNNEVVLMRHAVRKAKVHVIHKLTRSAKQLRLKNGTEVKKQKNNQKADKLAQEILAIKKFKVDDVSKYALTKKISSEEVLNNVNSSNEERALARLCSHNSLIVTTHNFCSKYSEPVDKYLKPGRKCEQKSKRKNNSSKKTQSISLINKKESNENKNNRPISESINNDYNNPELDNSKRISNENVELKMSPHLDNNNCIDKLNKSKDTKKSNKSSLDLAISLPKNMEKNKFQPVKSNKKNKNSEFKLPKTENEDTIVKSKINLNELKDSETLDSILPQKSDILFVKNDISCKEKRNQAKSVDPFFLSGDKKSEFLHVAINSKLGPEPERIERKHHDYQLGVNRRQRRRSMFGKEIIKKDFNRRKDYHADNNNFYFNIDKTDTKHKIPMKQYDTESEKVLHPSWQAKKMQKPQIAEFQGKKIIFDDN